MGLSDADKRSDPGAGGHIIDDEHPLWASQSTRHADVRAGSALGLVRAERRYRGRVGMPLASSRCLVRGHPPRLHAGDDQLVEVDCVFELIDSRCAKAASCSLRASKLTSTTCAVGVRGGGEVIYEYVTRNTYL